MLTEEEREKLKEIVDKGKREKINRLHSQILLNIDQRKEGKMKDIEIAKVLRVSEDTIERVRKRFVEEGHSITIETPIIEMSKADIIRKGLELSAPLGLTYSCYYGGDTACGVCDSCRIRQKAFEELNLVDPATITL